MAQDGSLHLSRPLGPAAVGVQPTVAPLRVVIQPQVSQRYRMIHELQVFLTDN